MSDRWLYVLPLPGNARTTSRQEVQQSVAKQGVVDQGVPVTETVALDPGEFALAGRIAGKNAAVMAEEFEELFEADVGPLPFFRDGSASGPKDGYYAAERFSTEPVNASVADLQEITDGRIALQGTDRSHWRALTTDATSPSTDFGSTSRADVGVRASATTVRWFDPRGKQIEEATVQATRTTEGGDVELYDADAASFVDPTLIYSLAYADEGDVDPLVWDDKGNAAREDGSNDLQWQHVFDTRHHFDGKPVVSNGLARLTFDESANSLSAEEWNSGTSSWDAKSLGTSDWELFDVDLQRIGLERVDAQVEFRDPTQSPTAYYNLDMVLHRGYLWPQWLRTEDSDSSTPSGLQTKLDPIASAITRHPQATQTLVERSETQE